MVDKPHPRFGRLEIELARGLTEAISPIEYEYFEDFLDATTAPSAESKDHNLGFRISNDEIGAITSALLFLSKPLIEYLWELAQNTASDFVKDTVDHGRTVFEKHVFNWIDRKFAKPAPIPLATFKVNDLLAKVRRDAQTAGLDGQNVEKVVSIFKSSFDNG